MASGTQTLSVRAEIREGASRLRPGQLVEAALGVGGGNALWAVPPTSLARVGNNATVYVKTTDGFQPIAVRVVEEGPTSSLVAGPFKGDERIAVKGVATLKSMQGNQQAAARGTEQRTGEKP